MFDSLSAMIRDEEGATLVEYSLVVALIAGICVAAITTLGGTINTLFGNINGSVNKANGTITQ